MIRATKALSYQLLAIFQKNTVLALCLIFSISRIRLIFFDSLAVTIINLLLRLIFVQMLELWQATCSCFRVYVLQPKTWLVFYF